MEATDFTETTLRVEDAPMAMLMTRGLEFRYPSAREACLAGVSLSVYQRECGLLTGPTGCGKSTLLKAMSGIIPHASSGEMKGEVLIGGLDSRACSLPALAEKIGLVFQSPDDQTAPASCAGWALRGSQGSLP